MLTDFEKVKLFLLADMIDDILLNSNDKASLIFKEKQTFKIVSSSVKQLTLKFAKNSDLTLEFDLYKNKAHDEIDKIMKSSL